MLDSQRVSDVKRHTLNIVLSGIGVAASLFVLYNTLPDLVRYIRIVRM